MRFLVKLFAVCIAIGSSTSFSRTTAVSPASNPAANALIAVYSSTLKAPWCEMVGNSCDSRDLLRGRGTINGGEEENRPNTIHDSCIDGNTGAYEIFESNDRIVVASTNGGGLTHGQTVQVSASVIAAKAHIPTDDHLDLYYAADANNPSWVRFATIVPSSPGYQVLSATIHFLLAAFRR